MGSAQEWPADVLLCDIALPDGDGYVVLRRMRERQRQPPPAIAITAFAREDDRSRAIGAGFAAHLAKPVDADRLFELMARVTGRA